MGFIVVILWGVILGSSYGNDTTSNMIAWTADWWASKANTSSKPLANDKEQFVKGVLLTIQYPADGQLVRYHHELGDIIPSVGMSLSEKGELADSIRSNVSAWSLCASINGEFHGCTPLTEAASGIPRMSLDTRRGVHVLRVWLGNSAPGRGEQNPGSHSVASRFTTHASLLGTGCRCVANWFLVASKDGVGSKLMKAWYTGMKNRWLELLDDSVYYPGSVLHTWRYFEMDCTLTELRHKHQLWDEAIMSLSSFSVGNNGDSNTPHECLDRNVVSFNDYLMQSNSPWMLKLKGDLSNAEEYYSYILHSQTQTQYENASTQADNGVPRIVWMFWHEAENDDSLSDRDRTCIEGWRHLNPNWEVRLLNIQSALEWAPELEELWQVLPDGARIQHMSDLLRVYLLANYGGVWADVSVLPLKPLDDILPQALLTHLPTGDNSQRSFFAYSFPDPLLSHDVSMVPFFHSES